MIKATIKDKPLVVAILIRSFDSNKSINYVVKQDSKRNRRIKVLMQYSFDICLAFGDIFLSDDKKACALVLYPDKKKTTLNSILWDLKFALFVPGLLRVPKVLKRESIIKANHPSDKYYHLWFIGVDPESHNKGIGSKLLQEVIDDSTSKKRNIYLETSTLKNIPWYKKFGFEVFAEVDLTYKLFFIRRVAS